MIRYFCGNLVVSNAGEKNAVNPGNGLSTCPPSPQQSDGDTLWDLGHGGCSHGLLSAQPFLI